ncbi:MAG: putative inorganic carbon transporter subunit DabA, partial [Allobranchiibius sp.]
PAWPLRNFVAANPLSHLEPMAFEDALLIAGRAHGITGRPQLGYYVDLFTQGRITPGQLQTALAEEKSKTGYGTDLPITDVVRLSRRLASTPAQPGRARHPLMSGRQVGDQARGSSPADLHCAVWAQRGWGLTSTEGPWELWLDSAVHRSYDRAVGIDGASAFARTLPRDPAAAIIRLAAVLQLPDDQLVNYLVATFANAPGWAGHASWRSRRAQHLGPLVEFAAVRMAHDVLFTVASPASAYRSTNSSSSPTPPQDRRAASLTNTLELDQDDSGELVALFGRVWQRALEVGVEEQLLPALAATGRAEQPAERRTRPASQSIWCIDVRSEPVRRQLESLGEHRTYGYAGFFGAAVRHADADDVTHDLCPGLVEPAFDSEEGPTDLTVRQVLHRTATAVSRHPLGALAIAEGGGLAAVGASTMSVFDPQRMRRITRTWVRGSVVAHQVPQLITELDTAGRTDLTEAALRATGLTGDFAPVLVICGHGASPENNAFATAYDCGACGGNDGVVNATLLVDALNDAEVRVALAARGIHLPGDTVAVVALHDTTTDTVDLLTHPDLAMTEALRSVAADLHTAGVNAAQGRGPTLPNHGARFSERQLARRAADWSEPTPEWGLAGNAAIVIGPRDLTRSIDLAQRVFLHSYDRGQDPAGTVLEQLLTAPLVVAQWINAQYYFSAVAPDVFGAGDKTTHNVVGDVGVLSGAHGDLRTGLPWQALFRDQPGTVPDAGNLMHEPVRLLAVVAADPELICEIVGRHETLTQLVVNEWIHLVCLDGSRTHRLQTDLTWRPWQVSPQDEAGVVKVS